MPTETTRSHPSKPQQSLSVVEASIAWPPQRVSYCTCQFLPCFWPTAIIHPFGKVIGGPVYVRHSVRSSSDSLIARLAIPDSDGMSLDVGLSAKRTDVLGVLSDFHLLNLLSQGCTVSERGQRSSQQSAFMHPHTQQGPPQNRRCVGVGIIEFDTELRIARDGHFAPENCDITYLVPYFPVTPTFLVLFVILAD
ncbi:unnamed protein product [Diplocarpon coronariae]